MFVYFMCLCTFGIMCECASDFISARHDFFLLENIFLKKMNKQNTNNVHNVSTDTSITNLVT